jgi:hypothetical protein
MSLLKPLEVELKSDPESWGIVLDRVSGNQGDSLVVHLGVHWLVPPQELSDVHAPALDYRGPEELTTLGVILTDEDLSELLATDEDEEGEEGEESEEGGAA